MKPKEIRKKLTLNKQTVTHLEGKQQDAIRGRVYYPPTSIKICAVSDCGSGCGNTCCGTDFVCSC